MHTSHPIRNNPKINCKKLTDHAHWITRLVILSIMLFEAACVPLTPAAYPNPTVKEYYPLYGWMSSNLAMKASLPNAPTKANVYLIQSASQPVTVDAARKQAEQFGIVGDIFQVSNRPPGTYMATTGGQRLYIRPDGLFEYHATFGERQGDLKVSDRAARIAIDNFMASHGFDFEYLIERSSLGEGGFKLIPLLDNIQVHDTNFQADGLLFKLDKDGQVLSVFGGLYPVDLVGSYPIRSANEAFQVILENNLNGTLQSTQKNSPSEPRTWYREYPDNQQIFLYGMVDLYTPVNTDKPPILTVDDFLMAGKSDGLEKIPRGKLVGVTGQFRIVKGIRQFFVENWKILDDLEVRRFSALEMAHGQVILLGNTRSTPDYVLADAPRDFPNDVFERGLSVDVTGVPLPDGTFEWKTIRYDPLGVRNVDNSVVKLGNSNLYKLNLTGAPIPLPTPYPTPVMMSTTAAGQTFYTVQPGDTFASIAQKFNTSIDALMKANTINELGMLLVGRGLIVPPSLPEVFQGLRGTVQITQIQNDIGATRTEYAILANGAEYFQAHMLLDGDSLQDLKNYQNRPVDIWGTLEYIDDYGYPVIKVDRFENPFPDINFEIIKGTQKIMEIQGKRVFLLKTADGRTFVELDPAGDALMVSDTSSVTPEYNVVAEVLLLPGEIFGKYPALRVYQQQPTAPSGSNNQSTEMSITASQPFVRHSNQQNRNNYRPSVFVIEKVELMYLVSKPRFAPTLKRDPFYIQPMWRFSGHSENGDEFEILVQALKDEFLSPEIQVIEGSR